MVHAVVPVEPELRPAPIAGGVVVADDDDVDPAVSGVIPEERVAGDIAAGEQRNTRADLDEHATIVAVQLVLALAEVGIGVGDDDVEIVVMVEVADVDLLLVICHLRHR